MRSAENFLKCIFSLIHIRELWASYSDLKDLVRSSHKIVLKLCEFWEKSLSSNTGKSRKRILAYSSAGLISGKCFPLERNFLRRIFFYEINFSNAQKKIPRGKLHLSWKIKKWKAGFHCSSEIGRNMQIRFGKMLTTRPRCAADKYILRNDCWKSCSKYTHPQMSDAWDY